MYLSECFYEYSLWILWNLNWEFSFWIFPRKIAAFIWEVHCKICDAFNLLQQASKNISQEKFTSFLISNPLFRSTLSMALNNVNFPWNFSLNWTFWSILQNNFLVIAYYRCQSGVLHNFFLFNKFNCTFFFNDHLIVASSSTYDFELLQ